MKDRVVYIAGPFRGETPWAVEQNVRKAEKYSLYLWARGVPNICPHTQGRFFDKEIDDTTILLGMRFILRRCNAVLVVGDWRNSEGAMAEMAEAETHGTPIFHTVQECEQWYRSSDS